MTEEEKSIVAGVLALVRKAGRIVAAKLAYSKQRADHKKEARLADNGKAY